MLIISDNNDEKINKTRYFGVLVSNDIRENWKNFAQINHFSTTSKLVRKAVNFYIQNYQNINIIKDLSLISNEFKTPLTSIKGFAQLLIQDYKNELDWSILEKIKQIYDNSLILEEIIIKTFDFSNSNKSYCDILIIEDDSSIILVLKDYFRRRKFKCKGINRCDDYSVELEKFQPKLILLDILLPGKDGFEICKEIKSDQKFNNIPVFYISEIIESKIQEKIEETGANGYFLKPFDFSKFDILFKYL